MLDMDGVIVDFYSRVLEYHDLPQPPKGVYNLDKYFGFPLLRGLDSGFWSGMEWMPDGQRIVDVAKHNFDEIRIVTGLPSFVNGDCQTDQIAAYGKIEWLSEHLTGIPFILCTQNKDFCVAPDMVLFDDSDHNVDGVRSKGGYAVLVPRHWNSVGSDDLISVERNLQCYGTK